MLEQVSAPRASCRSRRVKGALSQVKTRAHLAVPACLPRKEGQAWSSPVSRGHGGPAVHHLQGAPGRRRALRLGGRRLGYVQDNAAVSQRVRRLHGRRTRGVGLNHAGRSRQLLVCELRNFLTSIGRKPAGPTVVRTDSQSTIHALHGPVIAQRLRHIDIRMHRTRQGSSKCRPS
jgi:hypothetical protein